MWKRWALLVTAALASVAIAPNVASADGGLSTRGIAYSGHESSWHRQEGFPDGSKANYGLHLEKNDPDASGFGGVAIGGFDNPVSVLGFLLNGTCDEGLWFYVLAVDGTDQRYYCGGATDGPNSVVFSSLPVTAPDGTVWSEVRFHIGPTTVDRLILAYSPPGRTGVVHLDDITVGSKSAGKPGKT